MQSERRSDAVTQLKSEIESLVAELLPEDHAGWCARYAGKRKIIHDGLWGTFELRPHEVAILDTPLLQRLRFIRQTGAVYLTYPSAVHTRFEHTLGVVYQAGRMCSTFRDRGKGQQISEIDEANIRCAALLHDVGHGPFSHTSEQYFSVMPVIDELRTTDDYYENRGAGEILSSLIVLSSPLAEFISSINKAFAVQVEAKFLSDVIVGSVSDSKMFLSEIVHGPFDADKLDYMHRDGMFSGLRMHIDLDRLFASMDIQTGKDWTGREMTRLVGSLAGTSPLTQIMFNKMLLFTGIYHHHKVRSVDCMLWAMFDLAVSTGAKLGGRSLQSPVDFLRLTDDRILITELTDSPEISELIESIRRRIVWKRALVVSRRTVPATMHEEAPHDTKEGLFEDLVNLAGNEREKIRRRRRLANQIWAAAGKPCKEHEVWLDIPEQPPMSEAKKMWIKAPGQENPETLGEFIPITKWVELYGHHKWQAHVFCPDHAVTLVSDAAEVVLGDEFGLKFNELAKRYAHVGGS